MKKRLLSLVMAVCMLLLFLPTAADATTNKTQTEAVSWAKSQIGKALDYDGAYGAQCVDLIYYYYTYLGKTVMGGDASAYANNTLPSGWSRIKYSNGVVPKPGDIAVWSYAASSAGHVAIVLSGDSNGFNAVDQNWRGSDGNLNCKEVYHNYTYGTLACFIRPDFSGVTPDPNIKSNFTCSVTSPSGTIKANNKCVVEGTVSSARTITKITAWVENSSGKTIISASCNPGGTTYSFARSTIDNNLLFQKITENGQYYFKVTISDDKTTSQPYSFPFKVTGGTDSNVKITFDANGGIGEINYRYLPEKGMQIGSLPTASRNGYDFAGWYTIKDAAYSPVAASDIFSENTTLYAHWANRIYSSNRINFDLNGGSVSGNVSSHPVAGWNIGRASQTLVIFNCNGQKVLTNSYGNEVAVNAEGRVIEKRSYGEEKNLTVPTGGFVLSGHSGGDNSGGRFVSTINVGDYVSYDEVAKKAYCYTSKDSFLLNSKYVMAGEPFGQLPTPTQTGYTFDGWYTGKSSGSLVTSSTLLDTDLTLYARWTKNSTEPVPVNPDPVTPDPVIPEPSPVAGTYTVTYDANGGSGAPDAQTKEAGTAVTIQSKIPERYYIVSMDNNMDEDSGSKHFPLPYITASFTGWNTKQDGTGTSYSAGSSYTADESVTLYAQWAPGKIETLYTLSFNNGDKVFDGWYTAPQGGAKVSEGTTVTGNMTIYAHWRAATDPVIVNQEGVHFEKQTIYFQGQFTDVPSDQWFTKSVASAFEYSLMKGNSDTTFNPYGDVTIAEAITMASRIHSIYTTGGESFVQSDSKWYQVYLDYAYQNGIINKPYYNCDVTQKATRAQFAEIFSKSLPDKALYPMNNVADNAIPDVSNSESYAPFVYKLYRAGILAGNDANGTFSPKTYITRAESAAIVSRMAESNNRVIFSLN